MNAFPSLAANGRLPRIVSVAIFLAFVPAASAGASAEPLIVIIEAPTGAIDPPRLRARVAATIGRPVLTLFAADSVRGLTVLNIVLSPDGRRARLHIHPAGGEGGWQEIALERGGEQAEVQITALVATALDNLSEWRVTSDIINPFLPWPRERNNDAHTVPFQLAPDVLNPWNEPAGLSAEEGRGLSVPSPRSPLDRRPRGR